MPLDVTVIPGKQFAPGEELQIPTLNQLGQPTIIVEGTLQQLENVDPTAGANGQPLVWDSALSKWKPGTAAGQYLGTMVGANASAVGVGGAVPLPQITNRTDFLRGDGTWAQPSGSGSPGAGNNDLYNNENFI